jgi:hypothetical protein
MSDDIGFEFAYSEPLIHDDGDTVRLEWTRRGYRAATLVADDLIEQWAARETERRKLKSLLREVRDIVAETPNRRPRLLAEIDRAVSL